jgi:hypothetical protein
MVHHSKSRRQNLTKFIMANVADAAFEVSDVKRDGSVFVRFRTHLGCPGATMAADFSAALRRGMFQFTQTSDIQIRLTLDQFPHS